MAFEVNLNLRDELGQPLNLEHPLHRPVIANATQPVDAVVRSLTPPPLARYAIITVELPAAILLRFWLNGVDPTAGNGHRATDDTTITLTAAAQLAGFRYVAVGAGTGWLQISYF